MLPYEIAVIKRAIDHRFPSDRQLLILFRKTAAANREIYGVFKRTVHLPQLGQLLSFAGTSRKPARVSRYARDNVRKQGTTVPFLLLSFTIYHVAGLALFPP